jgi:hypothetical protein
MRSPNFAAPFALPILFAAAVLLTGCSISANKSKEGEAERVDIKTPLGDLHVNKQPDIRDAGLAMYPGATPAPKSSADDEKSANVNLTLPGFSLKVIAGEFRSDDPNEKILAFYHKELQHYGKVVECHGKWNSDHVTFGDDKKDDLAKPVSCDGGSGESVELKVGTEGNQHIVSVKPDGKGSRFALVYVRTHTGKDDTI